MKRHDQRRKLLFRHILKFVDRQDDRRLPLARSLANRHDQVCEIELEIAAVRESGLRLNLETDFNIGKFCLQFGESSQGAKSTADFRSDLPDAVKA